MQTCKWYDLILPIHSGERLVTVGQVNCQARNCPGSMMGFKTLFSNILYATFCLPGIVLLLGDPIGKRWSIIPTSNLNDINTQAKSDTMIYRRTMTVRRVRLSDCILSNALI